MSGRDKFLTEAMGECWHSFGTSGGVHICNKCLRTFVPVFKNNNLSTWEGFGKLWEWAQKQEWWSLFCYKMEDSLDWDVDDFLNHNIHPDRFANTIYLFLIERLN